MVRFECDSCRRLKESGEDWILGFAAENIGVTAARREITIASRWDGEHAFDHLAVHFCSDPCRRAYMARLFGEEPSPAEVDFIIGEGLREELPEAEIVGEIKVPARKRVVRVFPGARVETQVLRRRSGSSNPSESRKPLRRSP